MENPNQKSKLANPFRVIGVQSSATKPRQGEDYYATDPAAAEMLLQMENFDPSVPIWEPAAGEGHISDVFERHGYTVRKTDLVSRRGDIAAEDFLDEGLFEREREPWQGHIVTNPPFKRSLEFVLRALESVGEGRMVCMFLKLAWAEGLARRRRLFDPMPPARVWVSSSRLVCARNGDFEAMRDTGSAIAYCWWVWVKGHTGPTELRWFN